ncbi:MAG: LamG domain-containing protein, partial [Planctomycetota bacterium]
AAWIKTRSDRGEILSWGRDEGGGMFIFGHVEGRGRIGVTPQGGYLYMNAKTNDDAWHHVAAVVQEAELPNLHDHVKIFLDGDVAVIHDIGILDLWPIDTPAGQDVTIGKGFKGTLDDVRLYDRALSAKEIELLFKWPGQ